MLKGKCIGLVLALVFVMVMLGAVPAHAAYMLVWSDEFDGSAVDGNKWVYDNGGGGWGNNELAYYQPANATVSNGILTISAKKESAGGFSYTSTRMKTKGKFSFLYGKVEARILVPKGQGIWPAFRMLGASIDTNTWPACGEIDIMEHKNNEDTNYGTMHWQDLYGNHAYYGGSYGVTAANWHIYSIEWTPSYIRWFVDGIPYWEGNISNGVNGADEFSRPFYILLDCAIGGNFCGSPDETTVFPAKLQVDYVRVFQNIAATPTKTPTITATPTKTTVGTPTPTKTTQ